MSVEKATEILDGARGSRTFDGDEYTRTFVVVTTDKNDGVKAVRDATTIPNRGDAHPDDNHAWCHIVDPTQRSEKVWDVRVEYTTTPGAWNREWDPTERPPEVSWSSRDEMHDFLVDYNGKPVVNTAQLPFDPRPQIPFKIPICTVVLNETNYDADQMRGYANALNNAPFLDCPVNQVMCTKITGDFVRWAYAGYWRVTYELQFHLSEYGWEQPFLNAGTQQLVDDEDEDGNPTGGKVHAVTNARYEKTYRPLTGGGRAATKKKYLNIPSTEPVALDWDGKQLTPEEIQKDGPLYAHYQRYPHERLQRLAGGQLESLIRTALRGRVPIPSGS